MPGWTPPRKIYHIVIDDGDYKGLEAKVTSVPLGQFLSLGELTENTDPAQIRRDPAKAAESMGKLTDQFTAFAHALVWWNIELPGDPSDPESATVAIPANLDGLRQLDFDLSMLLVGEWMSAMGGVFGPLGTKPSTGENSPDAASLSSLADLSQPNSPEPS